MFNPRSIAIIGRGSQHDDLVVLSERNSIDAGFKGPGRRSASSIMPWPLAGLMGNSSQNLPGK